MTRPLYESDADRLREDDVKHLLEVSWDCDLRKEPPTSSFDYTASVCGRGVALVEVKCRMNDSFRFPTLMISKSKIDASIGEAGKIGLKYILVICWTDGTFWREITAVDATQFIIKENSGRTVKTRDLGDIEDCYMIPVREFRKIERKIL